MVSRMYILRDSVRSIAVLCPWPEPPEAKDKDRPLLHSLDDLALLLGSYVLEQMPGLQPWWKNELVRNDRAPLHAINEIQGRGRIQADIITEASFVQIGCGAWEVHSGSWSVDLEEQNSRFKTKFQLTGGKRGCFAKCQSPGPSPTPNLHAKLPPPKQHSKPNWAPVIRICSLEFRFHLPYC